MGLKALPYTCKSAIFGFLKLRFSGSLPFPPKELPANLRTSKASLLWFFSLPACKSATKLCFSGYHPFPPKATEMVKNKPRKRREGSSSKAPSNPNPNPNQIAAAHIIPVSRLSIKSVILHSWWLVRTEGKGLAVAGLASRGTLERRIFQSTEIVRRHSATVLEAADGIIVTITGFINRFRTQENGFSFQICNLFLLGFPYSWKEHITKFYRDKSAAAADKLGTKKCGSANISLPVSLDDIPATRIHEILVHPLIDSKDCGLDAIFGQFCRNPSENTRDFEEETPRMSKTARPNVKKEQSITPARGVVTRSMSKLMNLRKEKEQNLSSNSIGECKRKTRQTRSQTLLSRVRRF